MNNNQWIQKYNSLPQKEQRELLDSLQRIYYANRTITAKRWVKSLSQLMQKFSGDASNLTSNAMIYDLIRFIYWGSCDNHAEMSAFDDDAVRPFVEYLESISTDFKLPQRTQFSEGPQINICYLLHQANNQGSYAIGSMIYAMLKGHALNDNPSVNIHIISLNYTNEAFVNELNQIGFSVHDLSHERNLSNKINRIYNFCETENIDICISDTNLSCPTIAYQLRVAPIQIYWITGFRYWSIPNLDYHFMPDWVDETDKFSPTSRPIKTRNPREISTVKRDFNQDIINCERNKFPLNKKLIGSYGRLVKITADYLNIIKIILEKNHDVHVLLAGTGDATLIKNFINENQLDSHITLINHFVDGFLYSRLLDIFLDTFPNIAGQAAFEAQAVKTPVIHMLSQEWGSDLAAAHRDAELIANTPDEYVNKTLALLSDNNYYQKCAEKSHEILQPYLDVKQCAAMLESNVIELTNTPLYYHSN